MKNGGFIDMMFLVLISTLIAFYGLGGASDKNLPQATPPAVTPANDTVKQTIVPTPYKSSFTSIPVATPVNIENIEYFCTVPCGGMAAISEESKNCAKFTTQDQCTSYRYSDYPFSCSWQQSGYQCPAYP